MNMIFKSVKICEIVIFFIGVIISPVYLLLINNPILIPDVLLFIKPNVSGAIHLFFQLIFCELIFWVIGCSYKNTDNQFKVFFTALTWFFLMFFITKSGWIINEAALVSAISFISGSCLADRKIKVYLIRIILLFAVQIVQIIIFL